MTADTLRNLDTAGGSALLRMVRNNQRVIIIVALVIALMLFFNSQSNGTFMTERNMSILIRQAAAAGVAAMAMAMMMIMKEIDISMGSSAYLCGVVMAMVARDLEQTNSVVLILAALGTGLLIGLWQAFWIVIMRVPAFVATIGGMLGYRAIGLVITGASPLSMPDGFSVMTELALPPMTVGIGGGAILVVVMLLLSNRVRRKGFSGGVLKAGVMTLLAVGVLLWAGTTGRVPTAIVWVAAVAFAMYLYMGRTRIGRNNYVVGANREAANLAGINTKRLVFGGFVLLGVIYAILATLLSSRLGSVGPQMGELLEMDAIAGSVIGGISMTGGRGSVLGALGGALLLVTIDNGLNFMDHVDANWQPFIKAMILLIAIAVDMRLHKEER